MPYAVVLAGTGAIGRATARRLTDHGWSVHVTGRDPRHLPPALAAAGVAFSPLDRTDPDAAARLARVVGDGADLLVDCACFTAGDAARLLTVAGRVASTVMISSRAVYVDAAGNHVNGDVPPRFDGPVPETAPILAPGSGDHESRAGYGPNKVAAERVLLDSGLPVTVLRPSKVHGAGARKPREWVLVRRLLRGDRTLVLAHPDAVDHTTAAVNTAALIETVAARPGPRVLNSADPDAPPVLGIARAVAAALDLTWEETLLDPDGVRARPDVARTPWDAPTPFVLATTAAEALGYRPVGTYAGTVGEEVRWLVEAARGGADADLLPADEDLLAADAGVSAGTTSSPGPAGRPRTGG